MKAFRRISRLIAAPMAVLMFVVSVPVGVANAGLIPTERVVEHEAAAEDRCRDFMTKLVPAAQATLDQ